MMIELAGGILVVVGILIFASLGLVLGAVLLAGFAWLALIGVGGDLLTIGAAATAIAGVVAWLVSSWPIGDTGGTREGRVPVFARRR